MRQSGHAEDDLKDEIGFKGFVTSDWGAVHNVRFINAGMDMEMPGIVPHGHPFEAFVHSYFDTRPAVECGSAAAE